MHGCPMMALRQMENKSEYFWRYVNGPSGIGKSVLGYTLFCLLKSLGKTVLYFVRSVSYRCAVCAVCAVCPAHLIYMLVVVVQPNGDLWLKSKIEYFCNCVALAGGPIVKHQLKTGPFKSWSIKQLIGLVWMSVGQDQRDAAQALTGAVSDVILELDIPVIVDRQNRLYDVIPLGEWYAPAEFWQMNKFRMILLIGSGHSKYYVESLKQLDLKQIELSRYSKVEYSALISPFVTKFKLSSDAVKKIEAITNRVAREVNQICLGLTKSRSSLSGGGSGGALDSADSAVSSVLTAYEKEATMRFTSEYEGFLAELKEPERAKHFAGLYDILFGQVNDALPAPLASKSLGRSK